ncbi:MAG: sensor histidine kinase [Chloroflexota bacterium]
METLETEYERTATALNNMADGILIVGPDLHITRANPAALRLLRQREENVTGHTLAEIVRDHELVAVLSQALAEQAPRTVTVRLAAARAASGSNVGGEDSREEVRYVRATGIPLDPAPGTDRHAGLLVLQDVTELRRTDTVRREFVGNVSHELRTPLASLKALIETLEEGALDDPLASRDFLAQMHVEVDSLTQLVQELLELSRIESGQAELRRESVPPPALLHAAERRLRRQAERVGIALAVQVEDGLPAVHADSQLVERVLLNLVHNALKFTLCGGSVTLRASHHPDGVCLSVQDNGIGIPAADLDRIFERFYKVDRSRASRGTGLGLAIAKHILQAHEGRIWAESEGEGKGATLRFVLPLASSNSTPAAAVADGPTTSDTGAASLTPVKPEVIAR